MDEEKKQARNEQARINRAAASRRKLKEQVEGVQERARFHRWAAQHHEHKAWEVEADLAKIGVEVANEAKLGCNKGGLDDSAELGNHKCPPDEDEQNYWRKNSTDEEWKSYWVRARLNPLGVCLYDVKNDYVKDYCVFCGLPSERK